VIIELLKSVLIGIVQGITEWLPISSTGHMILLDELLKLNVSDAFKEMFLVVIQLGSILAVVVLFFSKLNPFSAKKTAQQKKSTWDLWLKVIIAIIPSGVAGMLLDDWFDANFYNYITVAVTLIFYGVLFIVIEKGNKDTLAKYETTDDISYKTAFLVGMFQILALIPGTSRSGSTIIGAMLLGLSRTAAAEFSFFMAAPTMLGASFIKIAKFVLDYEAVITLQEILILLVGCLVAFVVSIIAIKYLMEYIKKHSFSAFGVYRIILGIIVVIYFLITK